MSPLSSFTGLTDIPDPSEAVPELFNARYSILSQNLDQLNSDTSSLQGLWINVQDHGATGDGSTDDTAAIVSAITTAAPSGVVYFPSNSTFVITSRITIANPITLFSRGGWISPQTPAAETAADAGIIFKLTSQDITIDGLQFDGGNLPGTPATISGNRYCIRAEGTNTSSRISNIVVRNCLFRNFSVASIDAPTGTHAVYFLYVDRSKVHDCSFNSIGGAAVFVNACDEVNVINNSIQNTAWYSIHYEEDCDGMEIAGNSITGANGNIRNFGGSINLMSQHADNRPANTLARVHHNYISGQHSTYPAIRIASMQYCNVDNNMLDQLTGGGTENTYIRVETRGTDSDASNSGPCSYINIRGNILRSGSSSQLGIYADNQDHNSDSELTYAEFLNISGNQVHSVSTTQGNSDSWFQSGIIVHGQEGGWRDVNISDNILRTHPTGTPLDGTIGVIASSSATSVFDVTIKNNILEFIGTPSATTHSGINIGQFVDRAFIDGNVIKNYNFGIRLRTSAVSAYVGRNIFQDCNSNTNFQVQPHGWDVHGSDTTPEGNAAFRVSGATIQVTTSFTPASGTASGATGDTVWDSSYMYVCQSTDSWSRATLETF